MSNNLVIDLDGTLARWRTGGDEIQVGEWEDGARDALERLLLSDHRVTVASCRATWPEGGGVEAVLAFVRSGGFEAVPVVGVSEFPVPPGHKRQNEPEPFRLVECDADGCTHGLVGGDPCPRCNSMGVLAKPGEVGVWVGRGKPLAHWYIDDRALVYGPEIGADWPMILAMIGAESAWAVA